MKDLLRTMTMAGGLMLVLTTHAASYGTNVPLSFSRSWYDAVSMEWQPLTEGNRQSVDIGNWRPAFTFPVSHSNAFVHGRYLYSGYNPFCCYNMNGSFREQFSIDGISDVWKSSSDGKYCYMIEYEKPGIKVVDMENRKVVGGISTKNQLYWLRYVASLDNGKGGFLCGDRNNIFKLTMDGSQIGDALYVRDFIGDTCVAQDIAVVGSHAYLLVDGNTHSRKVYEYNLDDLTYTGKTFDLHDFVGQYGVEEVFYPRTVMSYTTPQNRQYLMFVDYGGVSFNATSILVDSIPFKQKLEGYNIYRDGEKRNQEILDTHTFCFNDSDLLENKEYKYEVRPVVDGSEGDAVATGSVTLDNTENLPVVEDFTSYTRPSDISMTRLNKSYFEVTDIDQEAAWVPKSNSSDCFIQYSKGKDKEAKQTLLSRPLYADAKGKVKIGLSYTGFTYLSGLDNEKMNIEVLPEGTNDWITVGSIVYKAQAGSYIQAEFDATEYVAGKKFRMRIRPSGSETAPQTYSWKINDIRIWQYSDINVGGKVKLVGKDLSKSVDITAKLKEVGTTYTTKTDDKGNFSFSDMQSGDYELTLSANGHKYTKDMQFDADGQQYTVDLVGGRFTTNSTAQNLEMGTDSKKTYSVEFSNEGNAEAVKKLSFVPVGVTESSAGNSDIDATEEWTLEKEFSPSLQSLYNPVYLYGNKMYQKSNNGLNEIDETGKVVGTHDLSFETEGASFSINKYFVVDKQFYLCTQANQYSDPAVPAYVMPVDLATGKILDTKKVAIDASITSVNAIGYNPQDKSVYVSDYYKVYKLNSEGGIAETHVLPETGYNSMTFDTYSVGGPYIWFAKQNWSPLGVVLSKYSLKTEKAVSTYNVNTLPGSVFNQSNSSMLSVSSYSVQSSTDAVPGFYSLLVNQNYSSRSGQSGSQFFLLKLFPVEKWITLDNDKEKVAEGANGTIKFTVNTDGLKDGDVKQANIILSSDNLADDVVIPVSLTARSSMNGMYPSAEITAKAKDADKVELAWSKPETSKAVDCYEVFRNGIKISSMSEPGYTDLSPLYGEQTYQVKTVYVDGTEKESNDAKIDIKDASWAKPVANLDAAVEDKTVSLSWSAAQAYSHGLFENFETAEAFSLDGPEGWTVFDGDKSYTFGSGNVDYDNECERMAGMIYNPLLTSPQDTSMPTEDGNSQMYMFASSNVPQIQNNDWLISPELSSDKPMAADFRLRAASYSYGNETLVVKYSLGGNSLDEFKDAATIKTSSTSWEEYHVDLPAGTKYVAFNYVSKYTYKLYLDDVYVGEDGQYSPLVGYNVYRDGEKLNTSCTKVVGFNDEDVADGTHTYEVESIYANGASATASVKATVGTASGIHSAKSDSNIFAANGMLTVRGGFDSLDIYSIDGQRVAHFGKTADDFSTSLSGQPRGAYLVKVVRNGKATNVKVII